MNNEQVKSLCIKFMEADTEDEVIELLKRHGFWDDPSLWRDYGDTEHNFSTFSNQQERAEYALVEKITNSVDAVLINECWKRGINPESNEAPKSIKEAVSKFFHEPSKGNLIDWPKKLRIEMPKRITVSITGATAKDKLGKKPCITISDCGEGQTPDRMTETILSIQKGNKSKIPFVQGEYNQGGTGALEFCGRHHLQLVISKRNPSILPKSHSRDDELWGFTIVRREDPNEEENEKLFRYTYLAPIKDDNGGKGVLRFSSKTMKIFPESKEPYARDSEWGTLVKLYEYRYQNPSSSLQTGGLLYRLNLLLPEAPLPINIHECRFPGGHVGTWSNPALGITVRLEENSENLEPGFPDLISYPVSYYDGGIERFEARLYVFKKGRQKSYKKNEGILLSYNGQVHGQLEDRVFKNASKVGHDFISKEMLVILDCSRISRKAKADLIMSSRDRIRNSEFTEAVLDNLYYELKHHDGLRELRNKRQEEDAEKRLADTKPIENVLKNIIQKSDTLSLLLSPTNISRLPSAFNKELVAARDKPIPTRKFPTYFKFKNKEYGYILNKEAHINERSRIQFDTDADKDYFSRRQDKGDFKVFIIKDGKSTEYNNFSGPRIYNGIATINVSLPNEVRVNEELSFTCKTCDIDGGNFQNNFVLAVKEERETYSGKGGRVKPPGNEKGNKRTTRSYVAPPRPIPIYKQEWEKYDFDEFSCLKVSLRETDNETGNEFYNFYINMSNDWLLHELKRTGKNKAKQSRIKGQYMYGMVLIGLGLIHQWKVDQKKGLIDDGMDMFDYIYDVTKSLAPILIPMLQELGGSGLDMSFDSWEEEQDELVDDYEVKSEEVVID